MAEFFSGLKPRQAGSRLTDGVIDVEAVAVVPPTTLSKKESEAMVKVEENTPSLVKAVRNLLNRGEVERLAFEHDPTRINNLAGLYRSKLRLLPDEVLKRIAIQDSLVAAIVRNRQNQMGAFGRPRPDRFSTGFVIKPDPGIIDGLDEKGKEELNEQIAKAVKRLNTCGDPAPGRRRRKTFAEWLEVSTRSAVVCGRIATEVVYEGKGAEKKFCYFVAVDGGTIFAAVDDGQEEAQAIRQQSYDLLKVALGKENVQIEDLMEKENYDAGLYAWVQVISGRPIQVFTEDELRVRNFYAVPDIELDGYPVTPLDTVMTAVTTHLEIQATNKLYFQSGRASRGMLIIKSDDVTPTMVSGIKQRFNASINSVGNSHRMPVFGIGTEEDIAWVPIDNQSKDMEFQYLSDLNSREILMAFMMSPDEIAALSYLSRGTNSQSLSESNGEYKLEAARDVGIRPLMATFEDFINSELFPLIDLELSKKCKVRLIGLESDNAEKEATRTAQDQALWMTFDDILQRVEKEPMGAEWGGNIPLNPAYQSLLSYLFTVGEILEKFCGRKGASEDPNLAYRRDEFFFNWIQMQQAAQQAAQQAQMQAQQGGAPSGPGGAPPQGGGDPSSGQAPDDGSGGGSGANAFPAQTENQKSSADSSADGKSASGGQSGGDLGKAIDQALQVLAKSDENMTPDQRRLLAQHKKSLEFFSKSFDGDLKDVKQEILKIAEHHAMIRGGGST